jgi:hypothetical protein
VDDGRAFLKIRRGFERTQRSGRDTPRSRAAAGTRVQTVWCEADIALKISVDGERARAAAGLDQIQRLPAKHFLREDRPHLGRFDQQTRVATLQGSAIHGPRYRTNARGARFPMSTVYDVQWGFSPRRYLITRPLMGCTGRLLFW